MAHHERRRRKNCRSGCLMCEYCKVNGFRTERPEGKRFSDHRPRRFAAEQVESET